MRPRHRLLLDGGSEGRGGGSWGNGGSEGGRGLGWEPWGTRPGVHKQWSWRGPCHGEEEEEEEKTPLQIWSRLSQKLSGKDIRSAGCNAAARKACIAEKWSRKGSFYQTNGYSLLHDGSHMSTRWQGLAPPPLEMKECPIGIQQGKHCWSVEQLLPNNPEQPLQIFIKLKPQLYWSDNHFLQRYAVFEGKI